MTYIDALTRSGTRSRDLIIGLWERVPDPLPVERFTELAATIIARQNTRSWNAALVAVAVWVQANTNTPGRPRTIPVDQHYIDTTRLTTAVGTVLHADRDTLYRLARLAHGEAVEAGQRGYSAALADEPAIKGWTRQTEQDPCEMCTGWAEAPWLPATVAMKTHTGCMCRQLPTTEAEQ